ncbi:HAD family hydrolase [Streptomyces sp. NPDC006460]|uniref:HAD family hydrolase n=1 Tax=Streptomyces sp. NPDC006460 TaxID=3154304 RepID=UPI0033AA68A2
MHSDALASLLARCDAVLFDFDGPICHVFKGLPAPGVAQKLGLLLADLAPGFSEDARSTDDPMVVHQLSRGGGDSVLAIVEAALTKAEMEAVKVAGPPTPGAVDALKAARASGRGVAVVSNNSAECIYAYLSAQGLSDVVETVVGRPELRPDLMKPSAHPLLAAAAHLGVAPERAALIGDSISDIEAARTAAARSIGFANKAGKAKALSAAGADAVTEDMNDIARALAVA